MNRSFTEEDIELANMHMKKCLASAAIRKMQIRTTMRYHYIAIRMGKIKKIMTTRNAGNDAEKLYNAYVVDGHVKWYSYSGAV